jgi:hypothetical protein
MTYICNRLIDMVLGVFDQQAMYFMALFVPFTWVILTR